MYGCGQRSSGTAGGASILLGGRVDAANRQAFPDWAAACVGAANNRHFQMRSGLNDIHCATVLQLERHSLAAPPSPATRAAGYQPSSFSIASHPHACLPVASRPAGHSFGVCNPPPTHTPGARVHPPRRRRRRRLRERHRPSSMHRTRTRLVWWGAGHPGPPPGLHDALAGPPPDPHPHAHPLSPHVRRDVVPPHSHLAPRRRELRPLFSRRVAAV